MADVTRRRVGELLRVLFDVLSDSPDGVQARDALAAVAARVTLTPYESGSYESGGRRFEKILRFATVDCVKAGWLLKQRGLWTVTADGKRAFQNYRDPEVFYREAAKLYNIWRQSQPDAEPETPEEPDDATSAKAASVTYEQAEETAWNEIEQYLRKMNPFEFQELVADLLRAMGYHIAWVAPPGKDGGIDILAWGDPLGTRPPRIKVQVKRQGDNVRVDGLRSFMALLGDDDVGLFVTTSDFTRDAADEARTQEKRKVTLVNLERLYDLWVEHYPKLTDQARRRLPLQQLWFLAPQG
jgi:restriction system protein